MGNQLWLHKEHVCKEFATKTNISQEECERKNPLKLVREQTWAAQSVMQHWIRKVCYAEELKKDGEGETYFQSGMLATDDPKFQPVWLRNKNLKTWRPATAAPLIFSLTVITVKNVSVESMPALRRSLRSTS